MNNPRGLELLHTLVRDELSSKEDCLVVVIHCLFVNKLGLCAGLGDEWRNDEKGSELLPNGWNSNNAVYTLRYASTEDSKRYLAKLTQAGEDLILTVLEVDKKVVSCLTFNLNFYVAENLREYSSVYKNLADISKKFDGMINLLHGKQSSKPDASKHDDEKDYTESSISSQGKSRNISSSRIRNNQFLPNVGRADLNPFGEGIGGGMLYNPNFHPTQSFPEDFPRGLVPPGARFDPIGPILGFPRNIGRPNPDHLPPPGYGDMFM